MLNCPKKQGLFSCDLIAISLIEANCFFVSIQYNRSRRISKEVYFEGLENFCANPFAATVDIDSHTPNLTFATMIKMSPANTHTFALFGSH